MSNTYTPMGYMSRGLRQVVPGQPGEHRGSVLIRREDGIKTFAVQFVPLR